MSDALPSGWTTATLDNVSRVVLGQSPPGSSYNDRGEGIPFFQGKAEFGDRYPVIRKWTTEPKKIAPRGSVLVSVRAPVGPTNVAPVDCAIGRGLAAVGALGEISSEYLLWAMRQSASNLISEATGSTFDAITGDQLRAHSLRIAPLDEQKRIVAAIEEHFSRLDAAEATLTAARRKLASLRRSAVARLFDQSDWTWTTLGEVAEIKGGVTKDSKRQSDPSYVEVPYLRVANVQRGYLDLSEVSRIRVRPAKAEQLALRTGDVLFNEGGDRDKLGRGWVWEGQIDGCIHQNHVFRARLSSGEFDPYFVSVHGNTWGQRWFETHGKHTTNLATLNLTTLKSFPVPAPPLVEQRKVVAEFQSIRRSEDRLRAEISRAESRSAALRRSILADAFSGRLVPQDPDDEPASVLLERIAESRPAKPPHRRTRS